MSGKIISNFLTISSFLTAQFAAPGCKITPEHPNKRPRSVFDRLSNKLGTAPVRVLAERCKDLAIFKKFDCCLRAVKLYLVGAITIRVRARSLSTAQVIFGSETNV